MASSNDGPSSTGTSGDPANQAPSMPSLTLPSLADDDSDEWEYEYSTSENEFYYLTLDLPAASIPGRVNLAQKNGRGGYKSVWVNRGLGRPKRQLVKAPIVTVGGKEPTPSPTPAGSLPIDEDDIEDESDCEEEEDEPIQQAAKETLDSEIHEETRVTERAKEIQILELHSDNPIVSFNGQTFSCNWAQNIGTELLFMNHDPKASLPVLRSLNNGIDLLAASSARLISKTAKLTAKSLSNDSQTDDDYQGDENDPIKPEMMASIPLNKRVGSERKGQAKFLERLIDVKHRKGETDTVTVIAYKRLHSGGWFHAIDEKRSRERARLQSQVRQGSEQANAAVRRLTEMDREDAEDSVRSKIQYKSERRKMNSGMAEQEEGQGPPKRRRRGGTTGIRDSGAVQQRSRASVEKGASEGIRRPRALLPKPGAELQSFQSTPTPQSWADLEAQHVMGGLREDEHFDDESDGENDDKISHG